MIREHNLDIMTSKKLLDTTRDIKIKECYHNIFKVVSEHRSCFKNYGWKVAYGYITIHSNLMARHAFIVDNDMNAIDPTIVLGKYFNENSPSLYISHTIFDDVEDYVAMILENDYKPCLINDLKDGDKEAEQWASNKGVVLIG